MLRVEENTHTLSVEDSNSHPQALLPEASSTGRDDPPLLPLPGSAFSRSLQGTTPTSFQAPSKCPSMREEAVHGHSKGKNLLVSVLSDSS